MTFAYRTASNPKIRNVEDLFADESTDELVDRAERHIGDLSAGKKRWLMSIPPSNLDSDLLLGEAIRRLRHAPSADCRCGPEVVAVPPA